MTPEEEIFAAALLLSGEARRAYLDRACGDDPILRENIEALLAAHASAGDFLSGSPAADVLAAVEPQPGDRIGPYVIIRKIGEGGCGLVFLAEQEQPLRRRVALKLIKPGMDSRQVIARFEAERQALAQMEHPGIARVFDAGATPAGRPYFAMEHVDGVPITRFCDETSLSLTARLELFERVCLALQHAHQKGVIHRDVKPSNILVALHDGLPAPKIIDFGIAKATQARLTDATLLTGFEQFLGTPAYMSPEQAERRDLDIDTRSDIYSLGVLLYELLAGQPPFDPKTLVRAGIDEIRRIIREIDPPRPSAALSTLGIDERTTIARRRAVLPDRLTSVLRGDLDWIVMRCMEKDRARRYGAASELADDIRRHLRSEPIVARPPSATYRARKFARRHRFACAAAAAVALALLAGALVSTWQAVRASRAESDARRRQAEAEELLAFMLGDFRAELEKVGKLSLLNAVGARAETYFSSLHPRDLSDASLARYARALYQIGEVRMSENRYDEAERLFLASYARAAELSRRHPRSGELLFERAQAEYWVGFVQWKRGAWALATAWLSRYRDTAAALVALDPSHLKWRRELVSGHHNLAVLDFERGSLAAARAGFLAELESMRELSALEPGNLQFRFKITDVDSWLGTLASRSGDLPEARARFTAQRVGLEALVRDDPATAQWSFKLAGALFWEAESLALTGGIAAAEARLAQGLALLSPLLERDPANRRWRTTRALLQLQEALLHQTRDPARARRLAAELRSELEQTLALEPQDRISATRLITAWRLESALRLAEGRADAREASLRALAIGEPLAREAKRNYLALGEFAAACVQAGKVAAHAGDSAQAAAYYQRALDSLAGDLAASTDWCLLDPAARALAHLARFAESRALIDRLTQAGYVPLEPWPAPPLNLRP